MTKTKKETKPTEQQNLFGDQDHVFNVLHTRMTDLNSEIEKAFEVIDKKESIIKDLKKEVKETRKAIDIVAKQRDKVKPKAVEKTKTHPKEKSAPAPF
jgi:chromosome segregation ATPase